MPLVAIILPVYNTKDLVGRAIESIKSQTFTDWHCYIVNDGSTDGVDQVLSAYQADPRFTILTNDMNKGISFSLNRAIEVSKANGGTPLIARIDADDMWASYHLEVLVRELERHEQLDIVGSMLEIDNELHTH